MPAQHPFAFARRLLCAVGAVLAAAAPAAGITIYVDDNAPPRGDGTSWRSAYRFLQDALAVAVSGTEIRIAQGTYKPDRDSAHPQGIGDRNAAFGLRTGVSLKGGYAGLGAPDPDQRDIHLYATILSGDLSGNDERIFANNEENSIHVVVAGTADSTAVLDGVTIRGGNANVGVHNDPTVGGGGMLIDSASPTVAHCTFSGNSALFVGGGLLIRHAASNPTINDCDFIGNRSTLTTQFGAGGGIATQFGTTAQITNCRLAGNKAEWQGGAMYNIGSNCVVTDCSFEGNSSTFRAGAIHNENDFGVPTFVGCEIRNNVAIKAAGMFNEGCDAIIVNCIFADNVASDIAGGMYCERGAPSVTDTVFSGNHAARGGGIMTAIADMTMTNCTLANNSANSGGGMWIGQGTLVLTNCEFATNSANEGAGIYNYFASPVYAINVTLNNCTFIDNAAIYSGGAMFNEFAINTYLNQCAFNGNSADFDGGAIYNLRAAPTLVKCSFDANLAGAEYGLGGAIANNDGSSPSLVACSFVANSAGEGGGISNFLNCSPTLLACSFSSNLADHGGGLSNFIDCDSQLTGTEFSNNIAEDEGGAMWNRLSAPTLQDCTIFSNEANLGAGLYNIASQLTAMNCLFEMNASYLWGGGMYNEQASHIELDHCDFLANRISFQDGSAIYNAGGITGKLSHCTISENAHSSVASDAATALSIHDCTFNHNIGLGASAILGGSHVVEDCFFTNSQGEADVAFPSNAGMTFLRCVFTSNGLHADGSFGRFNFDSCSFINGTPLKCGSGSHSILTNCALRLGFTAISNSGSQLKLVRCLIEDFNTGISVSSGGGTTEFENCILRNMNLGIQSSSSGSVNFVNCLLTDMSKVANLSSVSASFRLTNCTLYSNSNTIQNSVNSPQACVLQNCILWHSPLVAPIGNLSINYSNIEGGWPGVGNINADPMFIDPLGFDGIPGTPDDVLRLLPTSPCIDAANNLAVPAGITTDLIGSPRFFDMQTVPDTGNGTAPIVDMGAYEANTIVDRSMPGDITGDGVVNIDDLLAVINGWGVCLPICPADIVPTPNGNGKVDVDDLLAVINHWG